MLVVVLIIGILAAVALPQYQKAVEKSRIAEARLILNTIYKGYQLCILQHGVNAEQCIYNDTDDLNKTLLANMDIAIPGEITTSCWDSNFCINTKDWSYGTDDPEVYYNAFRIKNDTIAYGLNLDLSTGTITCQDEYYNDTGFCTSLCGGSGCEVK